jgi:hypothetical protein
MKMKIQGRSPPYGDDEETSDSVNMAELDCLFPQKY